jgi:hypothetical protein
MIYWMPVLPKALVSQSGHKRLSKRQAFRARRSPDQSARQYSAEQKRPHNRNAESVPQHGNDWQSEYYTEQNQPAENGGKAKHFPISGI